MNRTMILIAILIILSIVTIIFFVTNNSSKKSTEILREGNTLRIPVEMVTDGAPPGESVGP